MDGGEMCVQACKASGWLGEVVVVLLIGARALWAERTRRQAIKEKDAMATQVKALSLRPPPTPVTLQIAAHPGLAPPAAAQLLEQPTTDAPELIQESVRK